MTDSTTTWAPGARARRSAERPSSRAAGTASPRSRFSGGSVRGLRAAAGALVASSLGLAACAPDPVDAPQPLFAESPVEYPLELWREGAEGTATVRLRVGANGRVESAEIQEGSGHEELDSAAVRGARAMEFSPAVADGEPVAVWTSLPVHFYKSPPQETDDAGVRARPNTDPAEDSAQR